MAFYPPFVTEVGGKPFICYTDADMSRHFPNGINEKSAREKIEEFERGWWSNHERTGQPFVPKDTDFIIAFLWTDDDGVYVDVWLNRQLKTYGKCGPMRTLQSFLINGEFLDPWQKGNGSDSTVIVCGREAEYRRAVTEPDRSPGRYVYEQRPEMPEGFIVPWPD